MSTIMGFSKSQFRRLEVLILLNAMALSLVIPSVTSSGELPTTCTSITGGSCETQQMRIGYFHGTLSTCHIPFAQLGTVTPCTVTFSSPMTSPPNHIIIDNESGLHTFWDQNYYFQSVVTPSVWTAMPAAQTEIYGNSNLESVMQESNAGTTPFCGIFANVVTPGSVNAILRVQYSLDTVTWANLFDNTGLTDISIASSGIAIPGLTLQPITLGATSGAIFLRVVGLNGNGVASPSFTMIYLQCNWLSQGQQPQYLLSLVTKNGFQVTFSALVAVPIDTPISFSYLAALCLKSSC